MGRLQSWGGRGGVGKGQSRRQTVQRPRESMPPPKPQDSQDRGSKRPWCPKRNRLSTFLAFDFHDFLSAGHMRAGKTSRHKGFR